MKFLESALSTVFCSLFLITGCTTNRLADYELEITNAPDNFQLQATDLSNVTETVEYAWSVGTPAANINQACAIEGGDAELILLDANGKQVYKRNLADNGTYVSDVGTAGIWKIKLVLTGVDGTVNFRVQKRE